ncbi:16S rRNA (guanine(966)-N(2))-methyltransferase RsmD [Thiocapsa imhoffii]|uniref:16S rRNA (guanine(966)-N(2))-methyltransferase RsmD n=1 Tax=Thiocapsa imhoffii TaxID=382777 RepID=UPI0030B89D8B
MAKASARLRLVGGRWRGRRLSVPDAPGLRPTPDRVRETLFNWLAPLIPGARCLDVFAGSGALGFEALSRGAREVVMLERAGPVARHLMASAQALGTDEAQIIHTDALRWLEGGGKPFDIVFLDPPFGQDLWSTAIARLNAGGWLKPGSRVYLELPARGILPVLPPTWDLVRDKTAGEVRYSLSVVAG